MTREVTTNIAKNVHPGQAIAFTVSGEGQMPRNAQQPGMSPQAMMGGGQAARLIRARPRVRPAEVSATRSERLIRLPATSGGSWAA